MDFGYTYAPNLIHQGASVITEISSAHGYKNSASSNSNEVIHGQRINLTAFKKGKKLYKVVKNWRALYRNWVRAHMRGTKTYHARHAHDARLLAQKPAHLLNGAFIEIGRPPNH